MKKERQDERKGGEKGWREGEREEGRKKRMEDIQGRSLLPTLICLFFAIMYYFHFS